MRGITRRIQFVELPASEIAAQPQSLIYESRINLEPALRSVHTIESFHVRAVGSVATGHNARRKLHRPRNILLPFFESPVLIDNRRVGRDVLGSSPVKYRQA